MLDPITEPPRCISNADKVTSLYGGWPRFHDAEVVNLTFDRGGPTLAARILAFHVDRTQIVGAKGHFKLIARYSIGFRFLKASDVKMVGFNHQNVLAGIYFDEKPDGVEVTLDGILVRISCSGAPALTSTKFPLTRVPARLFRVGGKPQHQLNPLRRAG